MILAVLGFVYSENIFISNVATTILQGNYTDLVIPSGSNREKLHDEGQIANLVVINVNWTEEEVF